jgi:hypothetical protein
MAQYAAELERIARGDPNVSFVDLYSLAPDYQSAVALGYMADGVHFSRAGAIAYSGIIMDALVPEPHALGLVAAAMLMLRRGRRMTRLEAGICR